MAKQSERTTHQHYVMVAMSEDADLARDYVEMLKGNEIPARLQDNAKLIKGGRVEIMVPEDFVDQARGLIQARSSDEDFCEDVYGQDQADDLDEMEKA